jgi:hypothetical protein
VNRTSHPCGSNGNGVAISAQAARCPRSISVPLCVQLLGSSVATNMLGSKPLWLASWTIHSLQNAFEILNVMANILCPISSRGCYSNPMSGSQSVAKLQVKHRSTANTSPVFIMWKHARANLWATALIATTPLRFAFLR